MKKLSNNSCNYCLVLRAGSIYNLMDNYSSEYNDALEKKEFFNICETY